MIVADQVADVDDVAGDLVQGCVWGVGVWDSGTGGGGGGEAGDEVGGEVYHY